MLVVTNPGNDIVQSNVSANEADKAMNVTMQADHTSAVWMFSWEFAWFANGNVSGLYINFTKQSGVGLLAVGSCHWRNSLSTSSNPYEDCRGFCPSDPFRPLLLPSKPFPIHYSESFHTQVESDNTQCQRASLKTNCINLNKTGLLLILGSWTRRQQDASVAMWCCVTLPNRQDSQPSKRCQAPNSTSLHCLQATEESCELHDKVFEKDRKQLELCALCSPLSTCLFTSRSQKSS